MKQAKKKQGRGNDEMCRVWGIAWELVRTVRSAATKYHCIVVSAAAVQFCSVLLCGSRAGRRLQHDADAGRRSRPLAGLSVTLGGAGRSSRRRRGVCSPRRRAWRKLRVAVDRGCRGAVVPDGSTTRKLRRGPRGADEWVGPAGRGGERA